MLLARHHIDTWKLASTLYLIGAVIYFRQWNNVAAVGLVSIYASYGPMWVVKSNMYPDKNFDNPIPLGLALLFIWGPLIPYVVFPTLMMSRDAQVSAWVVALYTFVFIWGVFFHYVSDSHKYFVLKARPGLVTDGTWGLSRNINYFGELLIYLAFAGIPAAALGSLWPFASLFISVVAVWIPGMKRKDASLARYPEFAAWKKSTAFWLPFLW